jgi:nicotinamidase/pyrazinamidase
MSVIVDARQAALLVVDMQLDFLPGGALGIAGGDQIVEPIRLLMTSGIFGLQVATQDWHPPGHVSFASSHAGRKPLDEVELYGRLQRLWPDHCVQGTPGATLSPHLPWERVQAIVRKATDRNCDSYSALRNNWNENGERPPTGLTGYLRDRGVEDVFICGLARDYCCKWSAEDAVDAGFRVFVVWDCTRPVDPASDADVLGDLAGRGVQVVASADILRA